MREADELRSMVAAMSEENARVMKQAEESLCEKKGYWERIEELEGLVKGLKTECISIQGERDQMVLVVDQYEQQLRNLEKC